jgi:hypothetical protein
MMMRYLYEGKMPFGGGVALLLRVFIPEPMRYFRRLDANIGAQIRTNVL